MTQTVNELIGSVVQILLFTLIPFTAYSLFRKHLEAAMIMSEIQIIGIV